MEQAAKPGESSEDRFTSSPTKIYFGNVLVWDREQDEVIQPLRVPNEWNLSPFKHRKIKTVLDRLDLMLVAQNHQCLCCGCAEPGGRFNKFNMDHDHITGYVRALICYPCNTLLGNWNEDIEVMQLAIKRWQQSKPDYVQRLRYAAAYLEFWNKMILHYQTLTKEGRSGSCSNGNSPAEMA